jgi:hypothetical protein
MDESGFVHMTAEEEKRLSKLNTKRSSNGSSNLPPVNANTNNLTTGIKKTLRPIVLAESWEFLNGRTDSPLATPSEGSIAGSSAWFLCNLSTFQHDKGKNCVNLSLYLTKLSVYSIFLILLKLEIYLGEKL